jgi:hypothetical protein
VVKSGEDLSDGSGVGNHADGSLDLGEVTSGDNSGGLVVDTALETGRAPVNKLDGSLGLDGGNSGIDILRDDITTEHKAACHVLSVSGITLGHHGGGLESRVGDLSNRELLVVGLLGRDDGSVRGKHKVDTGVGDQVSLELSNINIKSTIETEGGGQRRDKLGNKSVQVGVSGSLNVEGSAADVVDGFVIEHDSNISVLKKRVGGKDRVVRLNNSGGDLGRGVDGETELGLLTVVDGKTFKKEGSETGTSSSTDGVEDKESLETSAVISELSDTVEAQVDDFLSDGVVTTGEVVSSIFLTRDQLVGVEELSVGTSADFIDDSGFEIEEDATGDVLSGTGFREEGVEGIISSTDGLIGGHLTIRLDTVLKAVEFPAGVTDLDTGLTDVNADYFSHFCLVNLLF